MKLNEGWVISIQDMQHLQPEIKKMISNWSVKISSVFLQCVHGPKGLQREFTLFFVFDQMNSVGLLYFINIVHN